MASKASAVILCCVVSLLLGAICPYYAVLTTWLAIACPGTLIDQKYLTIFVAAISAG